MDNFTRGYLTAALWSSTDDNDDPLDSNYSFDDIAPETLAKMEADCLKFQTDNAAIISGCNRGSGQYSEDEQAGHDFWLTRNGHGAGFWDGDWPINGEALTEASKAYGEVDLYIGDDGQVWA